MLLSRSLTRLLLLAPLALLTLGTPTPSPAIAQDEAPQTQPADAWNRIRADVDVALAELGEAIVARDAEGVWGRMDAVSREGWTQRTRAWQSRVRRMPEEVLDTSPSEWADEDTLRSALEADPLAFLGIYLRSADGRFIATRWPRIDGVSQVDPVAVDPRSPAAYRAMQRAEIAARILALGELSDPSDAPDRIGLHLILVIAEPEEGAEPLAGVETIGPRLATWENGGWHFGLLSANR